MDRDRGPVRVLHVVASTDRRGAETAAVQLAEALDKAGYPSRVVALAPGLTGGLDVPTCGPTGLAPRTLAAVRGQACDASVVIAHGSTTLPAVAMATVGTRTPFVYRSVGDPLAWINTRARRARVRAAISRAARVVALWRGSAVVWHQFLHVPAERIAVIPNAVPGSEFAPPSAEQRGLARAAFGIGCDDRVAVCLGNLSPEKRVDRAIRAVAKLPDVTLVVAGDGPEMTKLRAVAAATGAPVRFLGSVARPHLLLASADVLVVPSDTEGQPAVAIEAGLSGVPVVATRVGGVPEVVEHGKTGLLVDPRDADSLAAAIRSALACRSELGKAASAHCKARFDLRQVATQWQELIDAVLSPSTTGDSAAR